MTEVLFYHLERAHLSSVLPGLLEKTRARDWRALVCAPSPERLAALDELLWTYADESFLPHGCLSAEGDGAAAQNAAQPILLTQEPVPINRAEVLFLIDQPAVDNDALKAFQRCVTIFDGRNEDAVARARVFWKQVKTDEFDATYWRQSSQGRWEKQG